jgi:hypothetical protein
LIPDFFSAGRIAISLYQKIHLFPSVRSVSIKLSPLIYAGDVDLNLREASGRELPMVIAVAAGSYSSETVLQVLHVLAYYLVSRLSSSASSGHAVQRVFDPDPLLKCFTDMMLTDSSGTGWIVPGGSAREALWALRAGLSL